MHRQRRRTGFTFLEIMLVVIIIGILASIIAPKFMGRSESARRTATALSLHNIEVSLQEFEFIYGRLPETLEELVNPPEPPTGGEPQEFLEEIPRDAWNRDFIFRVPGESVGRRYDLYSMGSNGVDDRGQGDDVVPSGARRGDSERRASGRRSGGL